MFKIFSGLEIGTQTIFVPENGYFTHVVTGTFVGTVKFQKSEDGGATYSDSVTVSAPGVGHLIMTADSYIRVICSAFTSGSINVAFYNAAGSTNTARMKPFTVDYVWDFDVDGGANNSHVILYPSKIIPDGTIFYEFVRKVLTTVTGGGTIGLGYTDNAYGIEADSQTPVVVKADIVDGPLELQPGVIDVKRDITTDTITAGVIMWTFNGLTPEL